MGDLIKAEKYSRDVPWHFMPAFQPFKGIIIYSS